MVMHGHAMLCRVSATYAVGRVVDACGCIRGPMTWRDLAPQWHGNSTVGPLAK